MQVRSESTPTSVTNLCLLDRAECVVSRSDKAYPQRRMIRLVDFLYFHIVWELVSALCLVTINPQITSLEGRKVLSRDVVWFKFLRQTFLLVCDSLGSNDFFFVNHI